MTFADWVATSAASGTDLLATTGGWNPAGTIPVSLSYAAVPLTAGKPVASVTLPAVGASVGKGVPAMHIFSLTIGSPGQEAAGAPGVASYYDEARKDCVGTAASTGSKVWYTVADGELSDVYAPTIDNTDVKTLDPIVTGPGFTALQPRDMTYTVASLDSTGMACEVTAHDAAHDFNVVTDFITDPATESVVHAVPARRRCPARPAGLHLYLRFNPLLNGHAGGGTDNAGGESATTSRPAAARSRCRTRPTRSPRRPTAATPSRSTPRWRQTRRSRRSRPALRERQVTASPSSTPRVH